MVERLQVGLTAQGVYANADIVERYVEGLKTSGRTCSQDSLTLAELTIVDLSSLTKLRDSYRAKLLRIPSSDFQHTLCFSDSTALAKAGVMPVTGLLSASCKLPNSRSTHANFCGAQATASLAPFSSRRAVYRLQGLERT